MTVNSIFSLEGKIALVTGAAGYLGRAIAEGLALAGAKVYLNGRTHSSIYDLVGLLESKGLNVEPAVFDVTDSDQINEFFSNFNEKRLNILVNNAYNGDGGSTYTSNAKQFRDSYEIIMVSAHILLQNALPYLKEATQDNGDASIINIASMYGVVSPDVKIYESEAVTNSPFYGPAKAALIQWTKYTACEFSSEGIRVNTISPGSFPSSTVKKVNPRLIERIKKKVPMNRVGLPEELVGPVVFLASDAASFITGINLPVDGGWTSW